METQKELNNDTDFRYKVESDKSIIYDSKTDKDICLYFDDVTRDLLLDILNSKSIKELQVIPKAEEIMTAEEMLNKHSRRNGPIIGHPRAIVTAGEAVGAMEEYHNQFKQEVSDEEIDDEADGCCIEVFSDKIVGFIEGAKWMRDRMKGGVK